MFFPLGPHPDESTWPIIGGLYRIWFSPTHYYVGRAANFQWRWLRHLICLQRKNHPNPYMQSVYSQYHQFEPEVLLEIESDADRQQQEQVLLDTHCGQPGCVNLSRSARGVMKGRKHSEATRAKFRARFFSEETRRRLSDSHRGHSVSNDTRQKISVSGKGRKRPDTATRNAEHVGWRHTDEARAKISEAGRHRECTLETRAKIAQALATRLKNEKNEKT